MDEKYMFYLSLKKKLNTDQERSQQEPQTGTALKRKIPVFGLPVFVSQCIIFLSGQKK